MRGRDTMKIGLRVIKIIFTGNIAPELQMSFSKFLCKVMILSCSNCDPRPILGPQKDSKFNIDIHGEIFLEYFPEEIKCHIS